MGNGRIPAGTDIDITDDVDAGTSARIGSPAPGPIGLDAKSDSSKTTRASLADRILGYARRHRGSRVGDGECFTLVNRALRAAEARSARDYGEVTPDADYVWGTSVTLAELQPGDVIQFRDYSFRRVVVTETDSATTTEEEEGELPHHTAIVHSVDGGGAVTVIHQNGPPGSSVHTDRLYFTGGTTTEGNRQIRTTVRGTFWFYRPEAR